MKLWMDVMRDLEGLLDGWERKLPAWDAGGVDGLVVGPMTFDAPRLLSGLKTVGTGRSPSAAFDPDPRVYARLGVEPPPASAESLRERRVELERVLGAAKERGWSVWIFQASAGAGPGGEGHIFADERSRLATCARMIDTLEHFPMADGAIMDGPEWGYEIAPHHLNHRSYLFNDLPASVAPKSRDLGFDYEALVAARDRLFTRLHEVTSAEVEACRGGGFLGAFQLLGGDPDLAAWLAFRIAALTRFFQQVISEVKSHVPRPVRIGVGSWTAAFAPLCGYDFGQLAACVDVLHPKHYFWHRGFDGLVGTVYRYVETLTEWNPNLNDAAAFAIVEALFGLEFPGITHRSELETALSPEFISRIVTRETRRALAVVSEPERIVPWVDAGRAPHDGDPIHAGQLRDLLRSARDAGLERFLYHHQGNLTPAEWSVISEECGQPWDPRTSDYVPPDELVL